MTKEHPATEREPLASPDRPHYWDLRATVYIGHAPDALADELPELYDSLLSTLDWFVAQDRKLPNGACVLEEPHHVVLLRHAGDTVDVLNRAFACAPQDASRICRALFRAFPHVHRIHLDVMFPPSELAFASRSVAVLDYMVIDLPGSVDEYYLSLGRSTRRTIRSYTNRLNRAFPDVRTEVVTPGARSRELVDRLIAWKVERFREQDRVTYWETRPELAERASDLLQRCGQARVTYISGMEAAIHFCFRVGTTAYALEGAHEPAYDDFRLGFLTSYAAVCGAIESGATRFNALEGASEAKKLLGAKPIRTARLSVFRSRLSRVRSLDEAYATSRRHGLSACHALGQRVQQCPGSGALVQFAKRRRLEGRKKSEAA